MRTFEFPDIDEEELSNLKYSLGQKLPYTRITEYESKTPLFGYDYIDLGKTDFHFHQDCFDNQDVKEYFKTVNHLAKKTIKELIDSKNHKLHFHFYHPPYKNKHIKELLEKVSGKRHLKQEELPSIGQFALYTNENANPDTNIKAPRIYFMLGGYAVFYILFYDPFHGISK